MYKRSIQGWLKHYDFIILDSIVLQLSLIIAYCFRVRMGLPYADRLYGWLALLFAVLELILAALFNPFSNVLKRGLWKEFLATAKHTIILFGLVMAFLFGTKTGASFSRALIFVQLGIYVAMSVCVRMAWKTRVHKLGDNRELYVVSDHPEEAIKHLQNGAVQLTNLKVVEKSKIETLQQERVDGVFVDVDNFEERKQLVSMLELMGINVHIPVKQLGKNDHQVIEKIGEYTVLTSSMHWAKPWELALKRGMDIIGGLVGCMLTLLVCLFVGPAIKKESPGPLFYSHERIGLNGKRFKMYKIRSMVLNADELKAKYMDQNRLKDGLMFKLDWDPRIIGNKELPDGTKKTGIGEFIRKTSLDEFPQFFNVLKGDMSLVGTRPPTVDEWEKYDLHHRTRMATKPGITGMWQVSGRSDITDFEEVVRLDTDYIYNWNLGLDIKILLLTVKSVLKHEGAM